MSPDPTEWVSSTLTSEGLTPLPSAQQFGKTGFIVEATDKTDAAKVTVTARYTGQDKYEHWNEARRLADQVMDVLWKNGAWFEEIEGHEPACVFEAYLPADRTTEK
ncbi:hypothetical protein ACIOJ9_28635 [Streptomyces sp. NPDC088175]|uniref:hypothetical protein n=1 Tax=unclassified Streptomyces TaxID=2593676 RepID=UPI00381CB884